MKAKHIAILENRLGDQLVSLVRTLVASIGPVASAALREFDIKVGLESGPTKLGALMSALDTALS